MKKYYIKPTTETLCVEASQFIALSFAGDDASGKAGIFGSDDEDYEAPDEAW